MKLVFLTNSFNHHQKPVADYFYKKLGDDYTYIQTTEQSAERLAMGWGNIGKPSYVKNYLGSDSEKRECIDILRSADIVIIGSAPKELLKDARYHKKLIFRYVERPIRNRKNYWLKYIVRFVKWRMEYPDLRHMFILCSSAFTSLDFSKFKLYNNKFFKWGYFPNVVRYDSVDELINSKRKNSILWVSRMVDLKHPEHAVEVAKRLRDEGFCFELNMLGDGCEFDKIKELVKLYNLDGLVNLLGSATNDKVRKYMEMSEIFLFTSDHNEGWGAVLNESMNSLCAVVANARIGAAPFLIKHNECGMLYDENDLDTLYAHTKELIVNQVKRKSLAINGYYQITNYWNAEKSVENFLILVDSLLNGDTDKIKEIQGPCSKAEILEDDWFRR